MDLNKILELAKQQEENRNRHTFGGVCLHNNFSGRTVTVPARVGDEYTVEVNGTVTHATYNEETVKGATKEIAERIVTMELNVAGKPVQFDFWLLDTAVDNGIVSGTPINATLVQEQYTEDVTNKHANADGTFTTHKKGEDKPLRCVKVSKAVSSADDVLTQLLSRMVRPAGL